MKITEIGGFFVGRLDDAALNESDKKALLAFANEDLEEEMLDLLNEAEAIADPLVLFGVVSIGEATETAVCVNGVTVPSALAAEKLGGKHRCFPGITTCGPALEKWSEQYTGDFLYEFWADEIKKRYLGKMMMAYRDFIKEQYHTAGHLSSLNPGSLAVWPISGQQELFEILGGRDFVRETIGVTYNDSFLMLPSKTGSGIMFESEVVYENCQHCPMKDCPNRRAKYQGEKI